jgi:hypothetical protein
LYRSWNRQLEKVARDWVAPDGKQESRNTTKVARLCILDQEGVTVFNTIVHNAVENGSYLPPKLHEFKISSTVHRTKCGMHMENLVFPSCTAWWLQVRAGRMLV